MASYADIAASGPRQTPAEAAAPQPPTIEPSDSASSASLVDVDTPSVRTVPSDFSEQDLQTETQQRRLQREEEQRARADEEEQRARADEEHALLEHARADKELAKKKVAAKARRADTFLTRLFADLDSTPAVAVALGNIAAVVGLSAFLGYKAWGLYEHGRLGWKNVGLGVAVLGAVGVVEGVFGRYLYKGQKGQVKK